MKNLAQVIRFINSHPLTKNDKAAAFRRFLGWQAASRMGRGHMVLPWVDGSKLTMRRRLHSATANLYAGLAEFYEMAFALHFLRQDDNFFDAGANVGVYTVLASAARMARTVAVEPIPSTFRHLEENIAINGIAGMVRALNVGLSSSAGRMSFTTSLGPMNRIAGADENRRDTMDIEVKALDEIVREDMPLLVKIDTETHLKEILEGAQNTLNDRRLKAVIIELSQDVSGVLMDHGMRPYRYDPFSRSFYKRDLPLAGETIFIRDFAFAEDRVRSAKEFQVLGRKI